MKFTSILKNGVVLGLAALMFVPMGFCSESIPNVSVSQNDTQIRELANSIAQKLYDEQNSNDEITECFKKEVLFAIVQKGLENAVNSIRTEHFSDSDDVSLRLEFKHYIDAAAIQVTSKVQNTVFEIVPGSFYSDFTDGYRKMGFCSESIPNTVFDIVPGSFYSDFTDGYRKIGFCSESIPNVSVSQNDTQIRELANSIAQKLYDEQNSNDEITECFGKEVLFAIVQKGLENAVNSIQTERFSNDVSLRREFKRYIDAAAIQYTSKVQNVSVSQNDTQIRELANSIAQKLYDEQNSNDEITECFGKEVLFAIVQKGLENAVNSIRTERFSDDVSLRREFKRYIDAAAIQDPSKEQNTVFEIVPGSFYSDFTDGYKKIVRK